MNNVTSSKKLKCAILTRDANWFVDSLFCIEQFDFFEINPQLLGTNLPNPYQISYCDEPDLVFVDISFYKWIELNNPAQIKSIFLKLRKISRYSVIIGTEGTDWFGLARLPEAYAECDILLKAQGVYKDMDMYNYAIGSCSANKNWTGKTQPLPYKYPNEILDKIRLSLPCFITMDRRIRHIARKHKIHLSYQQKIIRYFGDILSEIEIGILRKIKKPEKYLHFVGGLTHIQRLELLEELSHLQNEKNTLKITDIEKFMWGMEHGRSPIPDAIMKQLLERMRSHDFFLNKRMNRNAFKRSLINHQIILAPTGFGELTYRHAEGWDSGRLVICQDLDHVAIMYPFKNGENIVYCKSDFSDIKIILKDLERDKDKIEQIGLKGLAAWKDWISNPQDLLNQGVTNHINVLLNGK